MIAYILIVIVIVIAYIGAFRQLHPHRLVAVDDLPYQEVMSCQGPRLSSTSRRSACSGGGLAAG